MIDGLVGTKICSECEERKPIKEFSRKKGAALGRQPKCKHCVSKRTRDRKATNTILWDVFDSLPESKTCSKCGEEKGIEEFNTNGSNRDGRMTYCRACAKEYVKRRRRLYEDLRFILDVDVRRKTCPTCGKDKDQSKYHRNTATPDGLEYRCKACAKRNRHKANMVIVHVRKRCEEKGLPFNLDEYRDQLQARFSAGVCEMSGIRFHEGPGRRGTSASVDRIDPSKGYVYSNIRLVCFALNAGMGDWGEAEFRRIVEAWLRSTPPVG